MSHTAGAALEKDVCVYDIYLQHASPARALEIQSLAETIHAPWTAEYIWQDEPFHLLSNDTGSVLSGRTSFGDCIEDEWFIVWILVELSRQCRDIVVRCTDTDGDFLLIESAMHLPRWLDPDTASHRAWIRHGQFVLIQPPATGKKESVPDLSLQQALSHLWKNESVLHDAQIERDAFARIAQYPAQAAKERHRVACAVPRVLATLLARAPGLIAPACVACFRRDPGQVAQFAQSPTVLEAEEVADLVTVTVTMTRTLYAQIKGLKFTVPSWYSDTAVAATKTQRDEQVKTGCKVTCGFDLLGRQAALTQARQDLVTDEEIQAWSQQVDSDDYLDVDWDALQNDLQNKGNTDGQGAGGRVDESDDTIRKMVEQMSRFLNTESTFEGADGFDDEDEEDDNDEDDDDEDDFGDLEDGFDDEDDDFMDFLRSSVAGASSLDVLARNKQRTNQRFEDEDENSNDSVEDLGKYMSAMDAELAHRTHNAKAEGQDKETDKGKGKEADEDTQIDFVMAKNMLESMSSHGGMSGPAAGLFARLGVSIPRNDDDDDDDDDDD